GSASTSALSFNSNSDGSGGDGGFHFQNNGTDMLTIDNSGNMTIAGAGGLTSGTGAVALNGATTVAANKNFTMTSGTGQFSQTYSGTGPAASIPDTPGAKGDILDLTTTATGSNTGDKALNIAVSGANGSSTITRYGAYSSVTATGASSTNVGGYFSASGASN